MPCRSSNLPLRWLLVLAAGLSLVACGQERPPATGAADAAASAGGAETTGGAGPTAGDPDTGSAPAVRPDGPAWLDELHPKVLPTVEADQVKVDRHSVVVKAGSEQFFCIFGTFPDDAGPLAWLTTDGYSPYLHHVVVKEYGDDAPPVASDADGDMVLCEALEPWLDGQLQLFEGIGSVDPGKGEAALFTNLPAGFGFDVKPGGRFVLESHFVNPTLEDIEVDIGVTFGFVDAERVHTIVRSWNHDFPDVYLPPNQVSWWTFDCVWDREATMMSLGAHMHGFGHEYMIDWIKADGTTERILHVPTWGPDEIDTGGPSFDVPMGDIVVSPGDIFRTTCVWNNVTDELIVAPEEMCTTFGVAFPLDDNLFCAGDNLKASFPFDRDEIARAQEQ